MTFVRSCGLAALLALFLVPIKSRAGEPGADTASRMLAQLGDEPLIAITLRDARAIPAQFARTHVHAILNDPSYSAGLNLMTALMTSYLGADFRVLWPDMSRRLSGPVVLALLPEKTGEGGVRRQGWQKQVMGNLRMVVLALTPDADGAKALTDLWPVPREPRNLVSMLEFRPVTVDALQAVGAIPDWAKAEAWPVADIGFAISPKRLAAEVEKLEIADPQPEEQENWMAPLKPLGRTVGRATLGLSFAGDGFTEELRVDLVPEDTSLARCVKTLREDPGPWDRLMGATPGEQIIVMLGKIDPKGLGEDLALATQSMERMLRGRRWARTVGFSEAALDPKRFAFLLDEFDGSFSLAASPALSGDVRITLTTATKATDAEKFQAALLSGLDAVDANFEPLAGVKKIGALPPLGATFKGRGRFPAPILAVSPGWIWLCSNSATYQALRGAFATGKTMAKDAEHAAAQAKKNGARDEWRANDSLRVESNLEKAVGIGYRLFMLGGTENLMLGGWKVPGDLWPPPNVFNGRLGMLRAGLSRAGSRLEGHAASGLPGMSLVLAGIIQAGADEIDDTRLWNKEMKEAESRKAKDGIQGVEPAPQANP